MANLYRIICLTLMVAFSAVVHAETTSGTLKGYHVNEPDPISSTPQAACLVAGAYYDGAVQTATLKFGVNYWSCTHAGVNQYVNAVPMFGCATGQNWTYASSTNVCSRPDCVAPQVRDASTGLCVTPPDCTAKAGVTLSSGNYNFGSVILSSPPNVCDGCSAYFQGSYPVARYLLNGIYQYVATGYYVYEGTSCTAGGNSPIAPTASIPPDTCASGQALGTINGVKKCVAAGVVQNPNPVPPAVVPGTTSATVTNPDNSTTTTTTTTNGDGSKTTTVTNTMPGGGPSTTKTKEDPAPSPDPQDDYCKKNPDATLCKKNESKFGGGCGAFSCEGDAIQCAIAREQHTKNCILFTTTTPLSDLGNAAAAGTDSGVTDNPAKTSNRAAVAVDGTLNTSKSIAAACIPDLTVQILAVSLTVPFSKLCPYMEIMGQIVIAFSLIAGGRIVSGGVA